VGWWESDMTAKHTQKIRAMDSGVLLTAYVANKAGESGSILVI